MSCAVIRAYPQRPSLDDPSRIIWPALEGCDASTFNLEEADAASSDADFVAKMRIALREAKEAHVAIRLIARCKLAGYETVEKYRDEANQLSSIFAAIVRNKKMNMKKRTSSALCTLHSDRRATGVRQQVRAC